MSSGSSPISEVSSGGAHEPPRRALAPTVTVVICAYTERRWPEITRALDSVRAQETAPKEVILVIDHDQALFDRASGAFPDVTVVQNTGPRGLSGARNTGVAHARAEIVAFLDDDAEAEPDWLTRLLRHYRHANVLAVGGRAVPVWEGSRPRWLPPEFDWVVGCSFTGQPSRVSGVRNLIGCNMSFRRDALDRTGGFDPSLGRVGKVPVGCEETEFCIRMRQRHPGGVVLYDPAAQVHHRVTADRASWDYFRQRCLSEGRSKAVVARLAGTEAGLSSEREYTRRALPRGVWRELRLSRTGDPAGLLRAGVIVAGLAVTATGYLLARAQRVTDTGANRSPRRPGSEPEPVRVLAVELSDGVPALPDSGCPDGGRYGAAEVLVRLHGQPIGLLRTVLPAGGLTPQAHAGLIEDRLLGPIQDHLQRDTLPLVRRLAVDGVGRAAPCTVRPSPERAPFVSVVVPTVGRDAVLRRTLHSLAALDYPHYEIVVVDNAPHGSDTAELVREHAARDSRVRYASEPRRGVAHARNRGLADARGEIVAFADDDVIVDQGWLRALVDGFTDDAVAAVTGYVLAGELETPAQVWIEQYGSFGKGSRRRRFDATGYETVEEGRIRRVPAGRASLYPYLPGTYGSGANMAFRTDTLRRLGGFDPLLGSGSSVRTGEDIDVLMRVVLAGHALVYEPSAIVWHSHKRDIRALRRTIYDYGVGLSAVMVKCLVTNHAGRRELLRRLPRGIVYALHPGSEKNARKQRGYPISLTALEVCGMAVGPAYYVRAAWTARSEGVRC